MRIGKGSGRRCVLATATLVVQVLVSAPARGQQPYTFVNAVDSTGPYSDFHDSAINDVGGILFTGFLDTGNRHGVFTGPDPVADALAIDDNNTTPFMLGNVNGLALNNAGTRFFTARHRFGGGSGIYTGPDRATDAFVNTDGPFGGFGGPALNNAGRIVFTGQLDTGAQGLFTGPNPATDAVVTADGPFRFFGFSPRISEAGGLVFRATLDDGTVGVFTGPDPVADAVATTADGYTRFFNSALGINSAGTVAFAAETAGNVRGIFTGPDPVADAFVTTAGAYEAFYEDNLHVDERGRIIFLADLDGTGRGIFTGPDPVADRIIRTGDTLFGQRVIGLDYLTGINSRGDVSFRYQLADRTTGIAIAVVPEPASPLMLLAGSAALALAGRRRR